MNKFYYKTLFLKNTSYGFATYNRRTHVGEKIYPNIYLVNINNFKHFKRGKMLRHMLIQDNQNNVDNFKYHVYHFDIETISKMFRKKFNLETIAEIANISVNDVKKILNI